MTAADPALRARLVNEVIDARCWHTNNRTCADCAVAAVLSVLVAEGLLTSAADERLTPDDVGFESGIRWSTPAADDATVSVRRDDLARWAERAHRWGMERTADELRAAAVPQPDKENEK